MSWPTQAAGGRSGVLPPAANHLGELPGARALALSSAQSAARARAHANPTRGWGPISREDARAQTHVRKIPPFRLYEQSPTRQAGSSNHQQGEST